MVIIQNYTLSTGNSPALGSRSIGGIILKLSSYAKSILKKRTLVITASIKIINVKMKIK